MHTKARKVMIIGAGNVGASAAYALLNQSICEELILVDLNQQRAEAHAQDPVSYAHLDVYKRQTDPSAPTAAHSKAANRQKQNKLSAFIGPGMESARRLSHSTSCASVTIKTILEKLISNEAKPIPQREVNPS